MKSIHRNRLIYRKNEKTKNRSYNDDNLPEWQFGRLLIGTEATPVACGKTVTVKLTSENANERSGWGALSNSVPVGNKTLASFGRLSMVGCGPSTNYIRIKNTVTAGSSSITVDAVPADWVAGMEVAISPSGPIELEFEKMTIQSVTTTTITFTAPLAFDHAGYEDSVVLASSYANSAEVGLLTRNIKIDGTISGGDDMYGGRVLVASGPNMKIYRQGQG